MRDWITEFWLWLHTRDAERKTEFVAFTLTISPDPYAWYDVGKLIDEAPLFSSGVVIR